MPAPRTPARAVSNSEGPSECRVPTKSLRCCFEDLLVLGLILFVLGAVIWASSGSSWSKLFCARIKRPRSRRLTIPMESIPLTPSCGLKGGYTPGPSELDPFHVVGHSLDASLILGDGSVQQLSKLQPVLDPLANIPRQELDSIKKQKRTSNDHASVPTSARVHQYITGPGY